jgi:hypothetical protein
MSLEQEVEHTVSVTNLAVALMRARDFDSASVACGVAILAKVLAGDDPIARTLLAQQMMQLIKELDPDVASARWQ